MAEWVEVRRLPALYSVDGFWNTMSSWTASAKVLDRPSKFTVQVVSCRTFNASGDILSEVNGDEGSVASSRAAKVVYQRRLEPKHGNAPAASLDQPLKPVFDVVAHHVTSNMVEYLLEETADLCQQLSGVRFSYTSVHGEDSHPQDEFQSEGKAPRGIVVAESRPMGTLTTNQRSHVMSLMEALSKSAKKFDELAAKEVQQDKVLPYARFSIKYEELKLKYGNWATSWPGRKTIARFVLEDIAIASFLICLWEDQQREENRTPRFLEVGCGNGFLVYILTSEGYKGKGVDIEKDKAWDLYKGAAQLEQTPIQADSFIVDPAEFDWVLGNHCDELTPWIPYIASKSSPNMKFWILPCCLWDFYDKYTGNDVKIGRYNTYLQYVSHVVTQCGYKAEWENMRLSSTKNISVVGRSLNYDPTDASEVHRVAAQRESLLRDAEGTKFVPKKSYDKSISSS